MEQKRGTPQRDAIRHYRRNQVQILTKKNEDDQSEAEE
jgi:hypothetical protein